MKYGIYDTGLDMWVKPNWTDFLGSRGIPMTEAKSEAFQSVEQQDAETVLAKIEIYYFDIEGMVELLEVREI